MKMTRLKKHPDKLKEHERTPAAEEEFKLIAIALVSFKNQVFFLIPR